ncbi:MAG TPA: hypothetical protein VK171_06510 [Fimbriimonas sp.]|nr:hypothetical protein [Fimbriimonas sp.]
MNKTQLLTSAIAVCGIATVAITTARAQGGHEPSFQERNSTQNDGRSNTTTQRFTASSARKLRLNMEYGSVQIKSSNRRDVVATLTKRVRDTKDAASREWLTNQWLNTKLEGDTIVVQEKPSLKPNIREIEDVKLTLEVPNDLNVEVDLDAGDVTMSGSSSVLDIQVDAGTVDLQKMTITDKLASHISAGQTTIDLNSVPKLGCKVTTDVGQIVFNSGGGADINASVALGNISAASAKREDRDDMGDEQQIKLKSGGPAVTLRVETGSIVIGKPLKADAKLEDLSWSKKKLYIDKDVEQDIEDAMDDVAKEMQGVEGEIERALKLAFAQAEKELARAEKDMKLAERDMANAEREVAKAMKDIDFKFESKDVDSKELEAIVRTAMAHAKKAVERSMAQARKSLERVKASQAKKKGSA